MKTTLRYIASKGMYCIITILNLGKQKSYSKTVTLGINDEVDSYLRALTKAILSFLASSLWD